MPNYETSVADGQVNNDVPTSEPPTQGEWDTVHDAVTGDDVWNDGVSGYIARAEHKGGSYDEYDINRSFFYFDTTGVSGIAEVRLHLYLYGKSTNECILVAMEGTQADTLTTANFDSFTGTKFGHVTCVEDAWNTIVFNALGASKINDAGITKICVREYVHDYLDVRPEENEEYHASGYYAENAALIPYLEVTTTTGESIKIRKLVSTLILKGETVGVGHQLRFRKYGTTFGLSLVATADANASPFRIWDGSAVKAVEKVV